MIYVNDTDRQPVRLAMTLVGAARSFTLEGLDEVEGKANYFLGSDPSKWVTNVARYSRVRYKSVYPGIDLIFHGDQQKMEYDFVVSPGADPNYIALKFSGASSLKLEPGGDLIVTTAGGLSLTHHAPVLYQEENGVRKEVMGSYIIQGKNRVGFRLGSYVRSRTLVIDPAVGYSARFGGTSSSFPFSIAVDGAGNAYVTGNTGTLSDLPTLPGSFEPRSTTQDTVFVYKLNSTGTDFVYTTLIGGSSSQYGSGIVVDSAGNAFVTGSTSSADFPVTQGAFQTTLTSSAAHGFVLKLNPAGNALLYATFIAGNYPDTPNAIAIDATGNAYITGSTESSTFPVTPGVFQSSIGANSAGDAFLTKLNSTGSALVYSTYLGGEAGNGIAVDSSGNAYIAGSTFPWLTFTVTPGAFQTTGSEGFVLKINPTGSDLIYSTYLDAGTGSFPSGIAVDASGNAYVAGTGGATLLGTPVQFGPGDHIYVAKLNPAGSALSYLTAVGGSVADQSTGIALDTAGNVYVSGWTESSDFPVLLPVQTFGAAVQSGESISTSIVFKLDPTGTLAYSTYFGSDYDVAHAIAVDSNSNAYIAGTALSTLFPVTPGSIDQIQTPNGDVFVAELSSTQACTFTFSSTSVQETIAGGNSSIGVTAPSGCNWIALSDQTWITITSASAGAGSGAVDYSVQPNTSPARAGILSIAGTAIAVSQPNGCVYALSTPSLSVPASGGPIQNAVNVTTGSGCNFTFSNLPAWMSYIGPPLFGGTSSLEFEILANTDTSPRSAILSIAGLPFTVNQPGGYTCQFSVSPSGLTYGPSGGPGTFNVSTTSGCFWTAVSNSVWLQVTSIQSLLGAYSSSGTGSGTVDYYVAPNASSSQRSGTFTVGATGPTYAVTQAADPSPLGFYPLTPCRIADTRAGSGFSGSFGEPYLAGGSTRSFPIPTSSCDVPTTAQAYSFNITVVPHGAFGYLSAWSTGSPQPLVATLNSPKGYVVGNAAIVPAGTGGAIDLFATNDTDVVIDINGYFAAASSQAQDFYPMTPCRVADTRASSGFSDGFGPPSLVAGGTRSFAVQSSSCEVPSSAEAYSMRMTVVAAGPLGYITAWPVEQPLPLVATLNAPNGGVIGNQAIVPAGTAGAIDVFASGNTDLIIDINGYFAAPGGSGGLQFYTLAPCRVADTRAGSAGSGITGSFGPPSLVAGATRDFPMPTSACGVPSTAQAYSLNLTLVAPAGPFGYLTAWPTGQMLPLAATLNASDGGVVSAGAIVPAGTDGAISVFAQNATDLVIDINGYFAP